MNSLQAKKIPIVDFLFKTGYQPAKVNKKEYWYISPLRDESNPSFKVDLLGNVWYDHGVGKGGNIIDLAMLIFDCNINQALKHIDSKSKTSFSFQQQDISHNVESSIEILKVKHLENKGLIYYLLSRKIPYSIGRKYLQEVYYLNNSKATGNGKPFFALSFRNDKGGYELRSSSYKGCSSPKYFTTISGVNNNAINLFEGFIDFLSALIYFELDVPNCPTIVVNSLSLLTHTEQGLSQYPKVNVFFDNDTAGRNALEHLKKIHPNVCDQSIYYQRHKDFNEFLQLTSSKKN